MTTPTSPTPAPDFSGSMLLPQTNFPMRAGLPAREPGWVQGWLDADIYGKLRELRKDSGKYFHVHLGPPYANGNFHMGHVLTYTLKDFIVRSKFMAGYDSPYSPGWDCHGLPIEWKIEQELRKAGKTKADLTVVELRAKCRAYARQWVDIQLAEWQRMGCLADWDGHYETMAKPNEAGIVAELGKLVQRGLVSQQLRSTQWSWAEETAMAEAEVEYQEKTSTQVYVALPLVGRENEHLVIWTTTPWTLPANRAVAVEKGSNYYRLRHKTSGKLCWIAANVWLEASPDSFIVKEFSIPENDETGKPKSPKCLLGFELTGLEYQHPIYANQTGKVIHGDHVTTDSGTGLVHIAPAHGVDDFNLGKEHGLDLRCPVDGAGKYESYVEALPTTGEALAGKLIWPAQKLIVAELTASGKLLFVQDFQHSYPVSWRSKEKLISRTTKQWFVGLDVQIEQLGGKSIRERSLELIHGHRADGTREVNWVPEHGENRIGGMIAGRPDWCISRQRAWGVPITIIQDKITDEVVADPAVWDHIVALVAAEGIDAWDARIDAGKQAELFPVGWLESRGKTAADFSFVRDILDVWFDSGTTHAHVVRRESGVGERFHRPDNNRPADVYLEGSDQHRGWFHSSLLMSVANYNDAPYETVVTNGFVVDGEGRKFSKSLGNGVEPKDLLPKYGMDIIRLWVASCDYSEDIRYSPLIMDSMADNYRKFRNSFRWLLGNLHGFDEATQMVSYENLPELEQYILHTLAGVLAEVRGHFDTFQFHKATRVLTEFCGTTLSNFYFDARKDVLYCDPKTSHDRLAVQTVLVHVFRALATHMAPLLPFTTDEAWKERYIPDVEPYLETVIFQGAEFVQANEEHAILRKNICVHLEVFTEVEKAWVRDEAFSQKWDALMACRDQLNILLEAERTAGNIGSNAEALVHVPAAYDVGLVRLITGVSAVQQAELKAQKHPGVKCPRCWRYYNSLAQSGVCLRCDEAVATNPAPVV